MKTLHFSVTPLAGAPLRIVQALNKEGDVSARLVVLNPDAYGARTFHADLLWRRDFEEIMALMNESDIFHFHHWFDFQKNPFDFDFTPYERRGVRFVRQIYSHPNHGQFHGFSAREIVMSDVPQLVSAQYHERYYPRARMVPHAIDLEDEMHRPVKSCDALLLKQKTLFYSPSNKEPAYSGQLPLDRWPTKGYPEVVEMLNALVSERTDCLAEVMTDSPHAECLRRKREAWVAIDDLVTGSYHLSGMESLAQGVPTLTWLDERTKRTIREISGADNLPWVDCTLAQAPFLLHEILNDTSLRNAIGVDSRRWMEKYWNLRSVAAHYRRAYEDILRNPVGFNRARFDPEEILDNWHATRSHDLRWIGIANAARAGNSRSAQKMIAELESQLVQARVEYAKLKAWTDELQNAKNWLEDQYKRLT